MTIYLDMLFLSNFILTAVTLSLLARLTHSKLSRKHAAAGCAVGSLSSLVIVLAPESFGESLLITLFKLGAVCLTVRIACGKLSAPLLRDRILIYITINVIFGGCCIALWDLFGGDVITVKNCTVCFNVPLHTLMICVSGAYLLLWIYDRRVSRCRERKGVFSAVYSCGDRSISMPAVSDTGNLLTDNFSGEPVIIFKSRRLYEYFGLDSEQSYAVNGFHLIPFETVSGRGLIPVTLRGEVTIHSSDGMAKAVRCAVGILDSTGGERAIFDPKLLI